MPFQISCAIHGKITSDNCKCLGRELLEKKLGSLHKYTLISD
jgi:hypothetical protein